MTTQVPLFINGQFIDSHSDAKLPVINPATQQVLAEVPLATEEEVNVAVAGAKRAFKTWRNRAVPERARMMFDYQALLKAHHDELAEILQPGSIVYLKGSRAVALENIVTKLEERERRAN